MRASDISSSGCYLDTLNPAPKDSQVRLTIYHHDELFEAAGRAMSVSSGMEMGVAFEEVAAEQPAKLRRWLEANDKKQ
jgi:PilZ domain